MAIKPITEIQDTSRIPSFNMTPIVDIVFLLIIFFLVVCRFIEAENFPVNVPDSCAFARKKPQRQEHSATVTAMKTDDGEIEFAVDAEKVLVSNRTAAVEQMTGLIDRRLENTPGNRRIVTLRIDENIPYAQAQYALAAVAQSTATNIKLAVLKNNRSQSQVSN